ncbi:hypothetical protein HanIR_Chr15g0781791 [Helianthus annuus]|nr:hypothetical protein HanIR_Chr15g0781791 [Helianthus annuus]
MCVCPVIFICNKECSIINRTSSKGWDCQTKKNSSNIDGGVSYLIFGGVNATKMWAAILRLNVVGREHGHSANIAPPTPPPWAP